MEIDSVKRVPDYRMKNRQLFEQRSAKHNINQTSKHNNNLTLVKMAIIRQSNLERVKNMSKCGDFAVDVKAELT